MRREVTAEQVVQALMRRPELLYDVKSRLVYWKAVGPWMNTGQRFGNTDNVWGLAKYPPEKHAYQEWKDGTGKRSWIATIRPTEEWSVHAGQQHPGKWYWDVSTGNDDHAGNGIVDTMVDAANAAAAHLRGKGWVVLNEFLGDARG
jgi:hypothetical protein